MHRELSSSHVSQTSKKESEQKIRMRFDLLDRCIKTPDEVTDEVRELLETDESLLSFEGRLSGFGMFQKITKPTLRNHGKLTEYRRKRLKAKAAVSQPPTNDNAAKPNHSPNTPKKQTKATLIEDKRSLKRQVEVLSSELVMVRSAYRQLLKEISKREYADPEITRIIEVHNEHSVLRKKRGSESKVVKLK